MPNALSARAARTHRPTDLDQLQGSWKTIAGRREARLLVIGNRFAFEFCDGDGHIYIGSLDLDGSGSPKRMDMVIDEGPDGHKGQTALCIYHLDGDILHWCPTKPGAKARVSAFPSVDDDKYISLVFKHVRPHRTH